jgi:hypothetical protein
MLREDELMFTRFYRSICISDRIFMRENTTVIQVQFTMDVVQLCR